MADNIDQRLARNRYKMMTMPMAASLNHNKPFLFVEAQCGRSYAYIIYRWVVALYFFLILVYGLSVYKHGAKWLILFTNWNFVLLNMKCLILATFATVHYRDPFIANKGRFIHGRLPFHFKLLWLLYNVCTTGAFVVSGMYWGVVYEGWPLTIVNITTHAVNLAYVLLDLFITGIPIRILHFYQPMMFGGSYGVFSFLYWAAGGTNEKGFNYTYKVLDWGNKPMKALIYTCVLTFIVAPTCHALVFTTYRLRRWGYMKCACEMQKGRVGSEGDKSHYKMINGKDKLFASYSLTKMFNKKKDVGIKKH